MALHLHSVTFDCRAPASRARFWASVTGYGIGRANEFFAEPTGDGALGPRFMFIKVPEGKTAKNTVHLDGTADLDGEIERVQSVGGELVGRHDDWGVKLATFCDPEGKRVLHRSS